MAGKAIHSNVDLITKGKLVVEKLGRAATLNEFVAAGVCSHQTLERRFGGIVKFNELCGVENADPRPKFDLNAIREERRERAGNKELAKENKLLHEEVDRLEKLVDEYALIATPTRPRLVAPKPKSGGKDVAAVVFANSDRHVEAEIKPEIVRGKNAHNLEIAQERSHNLMMNQIKALDMLRTRAQITQGIYWLGGDWIENSNMHDGYEKTCLLGPADAMKFAKDMLTRELNYVLKHSDLNEITVVCNYGNHDRTTKNMRYDCAAEDSYAWPMYKDLRDSIRDPRIKWYIPAAEDEIIDIYGLKHRFMHGYTVQGGRGVDGITGPFIRRVIAMNKTEAADLTMIGHVHTLGFYPFGVSNSSTLGWGPFAKAHNFPFEQATQAAYLISASRRMMTVRMPIFVDKKGVEWVY